MMALDYPHPPETCFQTHSPGTPKEKGKEAAPETPGDENWSTMQENGAAMGTVGEIGPVGELLLADCAPVGTRDYDDECGDSGLNSTGG